MQSSLTVKGDALSVSLPDVWRLYDRQARFAYNTGSFFNMLIGGVGSGKSVALCCWILTRALLQPGETGALLGRTSVDLQTVLLPCLFERLQELQEHTGINWIKDYDKGNGVLTLANGFRLWFRPYNRIAKLRGITLSVVGCDECEWSEADPEEIWSVLTGRLRGRGRYPGIAFATSPNGLRGITKKFVDAQHLYCDAVARGDRAAQLLWGRYSVTSCTSFDNPFLPAHFFDSLRSMSKRRYEQEALGKILQPLNTCLSLEARHLIDWDWRQHPQLPRVYGVDWGTQDHHVALMFQVEASGRWVCCQELVCDGIPQMQFQAKLHAWIDGHGRQAPAMIAVDRAIPILNQGTQVRYRGTPVRWMESKAEQQVTRGIELMRDLMDPQDGNPKIVFARNSLSQVVTGLTAGIIPALRGFCYLLDANGMPTNKPKHDAINSHAVDAARYAVMGSANMAELHGGRRLNVPEVTFRPEEAGQVGNSGRQAP
jgi:hypothetical protein